MKIEEKFTEQCNKHSDINEHLNNLYQLGKRCKTIVEFGVREVVSSYAFAHAKPEKLTCVDIYKSNNIDTFLEECKEENVNAHFIHDSTLDIEIEPTDMLFIDTLHTFTQLSRELEKHHSKINKYIVMHDTSTFGFRDEIDTPSIYKGLVPAIQQFLKMHTEWTVAQVFENNNGLTILKKI